MYSILAIDIYAQYQQVLKKSISQSDSMFDFIPGKRNGHQ